MNRDYIFNYEGKNYLILKFSDLTALGNMYRGVWYFRHPDYYVYAAIENKNPGQGDKYEEKLSKISCGNLSFSTSKNDRNVKSIGTYSAKLYKSDDERDSMRFISFYELEVSDTGVLGKVDNQMKDFGDYVAVVQYNKLCGELKNSYSIQNIQVQYLEDNYCGAIGDGCKNRKYSYQKERRLIIKSENFLSKIRENVDLTAIQKKYFELRKIMGDSCKSNSERIKAEKEIDKLMLREIEIKKDFYSEIKTQCGLLFKIIPTERLFKIKNISELI